MGQSQQRNVQGYQQGSRWKQLHKNMQHALPHLSLLAESAQTLAVPVLDLTSKSHQNMLDIYRYYASRQQHCSLASVKILKLSMTDSSGRDLVPVLEQSLPSHSKKSDSNAVTCSFNIFQGYCQRNIPDPSAFRGKLSLFVEYYPNNLEAESGRRKEKGRTFSEKEIGEMLAVVVSEAKTMLQLKLKEPLLSPKGIKIDQTGKWRVAEWELTHFVEGEGEEETGFADQGETLLVIEGHKESTQEFDILGHYYWAPEGTTAMKSLTRIGMHSSGASQPKGQIFSLGMTILHLLLERPLYQLETYSQQTIESYLSEAIHYREQSKIPLSSELASILRQMLMWNPKERIGYGELEKRLDGLIQIDTVRGEIQSGSRTSLRIPFSGSLRVPVTTSVRVTVNSNSGRDVDGSGSIDQGEGDETHPEQQIPCEKSENTTRAKTQEYSLDYKKLDYTIRRERKEWQMFQNRLSTSHSHQSFSHDFKNNFSSAPGSFPCEVLKEDEEDKPNQEVLCLMLPDNRREREVTDEEEEAGTGAVPSSRGPNESNLTESIKLLDISNIKARKLSEKNFNKNRTNSNHQLFNQMLFENQQSFSTLLHGKNINVQAFMNESDSLLLKSSTSPKLAKEKFQNKKEEKDYKVCEENSGLFTSPELMAFIRESTYKPKETEKRTSRKKAQPQNKDNESFEHSSGFVTEQFAKGWYEGGKVDGLRHGYGTFHYNEGGKYCGDWLNSQMHGRGTLYYADGRIAYQGQWSCDSLNGTGILYNENPRKIVVPFDYRNFNLSEDVWVYYEGSFVNDDKSGQGVLLLTNGQKFEGTFQGDLVEGRGTFYCGNGEIIRGLWKGNKLVEVQSIEGNSESSEPMRMSIQNQ